jgi:hypothetical protein
MVQSNEESSIWGPLFTFLGVVALAAAALRLWRFGELRPYIVTIETPLGEKRSSDDIAASHEPGPRAA